MPSKHYKYGGSTAGRVLQCPAWIKLAESMPDKDRADGNIHADRGTLLHDAIEQMLKTDDIDPMSFIGERLNDAELTEDDIREALIPAYNAYLDYADQENIQGELLEVTMQIDEEVGGTADFIGLNDDTIYIGDWKFGYNTVDPEENPQGLFYAMCLAEDERYSRLWEGRDKLKIFIGQPANALEGKDIIQVYETTRERLNRFTDEYLSALDNQDKDNQVTGSYCQYCPATPICPEKTGLARKALMLDPKSQEAEILEQALEIADEVEAWAKQVKNFAHQQMELGLKVKGFKLVDKRATRKWTDEDAVLAMVKKARKIKLEEATTSKLMTPAQLEKVFSKKEVDFNKYEAYISKVSSGTTLAKASDKRPEAVPVAALADAIKKND